MESLKHKVAKGQRSLEFSNLGAKFSAGKGCKLPTHRKLIEVSAVVNGCSLSVKAMMKFPGDEQARFT
eukprot:2315529-Amphidinium_carterae.1